MAVRLPALAMAVLVIAPMAADALASGPCQAIPGVIDRCPVWSSTYDHGGQDVPAGAVMSPTGDALYLSTFSADGAGGDVGTATVALDPVTGTVRWVAREAGPGPTDPALYDVAVSPDGSRVYAIGALGWNTGLCAPNPCQDAFVAAYDAGSGATLWKTTVDGPVGGWDYLSAIAVSPDGSRVFVAGASQGVDNQPPFVGSFDRGTLDVLAMALDAGTGDEAWSARFDRVPGEHDAAVSIAVSPDGTRVFVGGNTAGPHPADGDTDYLTLAYDSGISDGTDEQHGGQLLWAARYDSEAPKDLVLPWDSASDMAVAPDGSRLYVTGQLGADRPSSGNELFYNPPTDYGTIAYDASDGSVEWVARYTGVAGGYNTALDLALAPGGDGLFVTGISSGETWENTNDRNAAVVAYDAEDGSQEWVSTYAPGYAYGWGVAVHGDRVYLAASSTLYSVTAAYSSATGADAWTATGLPGSDPATMDHVEARGIVAGPDRLFALGVAYPLSFGESDARVLAFEY